MRCLRMATSAIALAVAASTLAAQGSPALDAAAQAMGGKERIRAIRTLILEGAGDNLNFGQNHTPYAATKFEVTSFRRSFDFPNRRWFLDQTRVPRFVTANTNPVRQRLGLDGDIAYNIGGGPPPAPGVQPPALMTRVGGPAAIDRVFEYFYHPVGFVMAAYAAGTEIFEESAPNNMRLVRVTAGGNKVAMLIDARTKLPVRVEKMVYQPMLGDVTLFTEFSDWRDVGGLKLPMRITQKYENLFTISDVHLTSTWVDENVGNIAATDSIRNATVVQAGNPPPPAIVVDSLAPGVWRIAGGTHHSVAIEQSNRIVLVEAPQNDARSLAAIAKARELRPGKPLDLLINTHHHFDHAGGLRAAMSEGLTILTHEGNKDFYEKVYARRHFIQPDALQQNPKPLRITTSGDRRALRDTMRTIEILHVPGNPHNGNMLVVYLPAEKILIQADLYNPPAPNAAAPPSFPFAANLLEMIQRRGLSVDRVIGIHGNPVSFSEFQAAATRAP